MNFMFLATIARWLGELRRRHLVWADCINWKTIVRTVVLEKQPREELVRSRTVAKVDSIGFVVLRLAQCSAGNA